MKDESAAGYHPVPGFNPPSTKRGRQAVEGILAAARALLLEVGPERFSLREVARRAEYTAAALYNHFDGVDALTSLLALESVQVLGSYLERVSPDLPAPQRLRALGEAYLAFARLERERYQLVFSTLASPEPRWSEYVRTAYPFTILVDACADGIANGELRDQPDVGPAGMAYGLWCMVHGMVMLSSHHLGTITERDLAPLQTAALRSCIRGLESGTGQSA